MTIRKRRLPGLEPPKVADDEMRRFMENVREYLLMYEGTKGFPQQRFVTIEELEAAGLIRTTTKNNRAEISQVNVGGSLTDVGAVNPDGTTGDPVDDSSGDGTDSGFTKSVVIVNVYKRSPFLPLAPLKNDGSYNFRTLTLTPPVGWESAPPAGTDNLYVSTGSFSVEGTDGIDETVDWTVPDLLLTDGQGSIVVNAYQRAASAPATPAEDDGQYDFDTQTLTPPTGWFATPPATDGNPLYVTTGSFRAPVGNTGIDTTVVWTTPDLLLQDGNAGKSVFHASIYKRSASTPSPNPPTGGSYDFTNKVLTPPAGWSSAPPATDGNPLWVSNAIAEIAGTEGVDATLTWTSASQLVSDGVDGVTGDPGNSVFHASAYKRSASTPSPNPPTGGSYNFTTKTLTPPTGWSATPPATDGNPLWVTNSIAEISGTTGIDSTLTWTSAAQMVSDGVDGTDGTNGTDGTDGLVSLLTNEAHVVAAGSDGTGYSLTGSGGTHKVISGSTFVTTSATHSVVGSATKNGLTMSVVSGTGVYSLSGASWTSDAETFTLRATYNGVNLDKEYTIAKAKAGSDAGGVAITVSGEAGINHSTGGAGTATAGVRVNADGTIDKLVNTTYTQIDPGTDWKRPTNTLGLTFHVKMDVASGSSAITGDSTGTWLELNADREWKYVESGSSVKSGTWTISISGDGGASVADSGSYSVTADDTP